jgi:F-type H+-transporting ATPase subunit a
MFIFKFFLWLMRLIKYIIACAFIFSFHPVFSSVPDSTENKKFNTVEFIFDHVNDSHEWYFFSVGEKHIAVPLPVILYSKNTGWHFFFSNKFSHPDEGFRFKLIKENNESKIVEILDDGSEVAPFDLSITKTVLGMIISAILLLIVLIPASRKTSLNPMNPTRGVQNAVEPVVLFIRDDIAKPFIGKKFNKYLPYLLTIFSFILICNLIGLLLPLGFNITGNIAVTMVLATFTFIITTASSNKNYWLGIVNPEVPWFMKIPLPLIPFIEFLGIFTKPIILMVRLFANMFAGHMIVTVLIALIFLMSFIFNPFVGAGTSIISVVFSLFMLLVDLLIAFIQAYIFTLLSAMYFGMATSESKH